MPSKFTLKAAVQFIGKSGPTGQIGKVVAIDGGPGKPVGVEFDKAVEKGHSCDGKAKQGHGWWCLDDELKTA